MGTDKREITPYRMQQLMNVAADVSNRIVNNRHAYSITWDVIIVDECHRLSGTPASVTMFYKVMSNLAGVKLKDSSTTDTQLIRKVSKGASM